MRLAVIGAGWAGLALALRAQAQGAKVSLWEMAAHAGGRARSLPQPHQHEGRVYHLDNGQHIMLAAYSQTLALLRDLGLNPTQLFLRQPLDLRFADGRGLFMRGGLAFSKGWGLTNYLALVRLGWRLWQTKRRPPSAAAGPTVERWMADFPQALKEEFLHPICLSALNTQADEACAYSLAKVLVQAASAYGAADMLLPRLPLGQIFPEKAVQHLRAQGAQVHLGQRVQTLPQGYDCTVLACSAAEAARLVQDQSPLWAAQAEALPQRAIATVYLRARGALTRPMVQLRHPVLQFAFDLQAIQGQSGLVSMVASAYRDDAAGGRSGLCEAALHLAHTELGLRQAEVLRCMVEKRATYACLPGLERPAANIGPGLLACGDYVASNPYPSTLEGAVISAQNAWNLCLQGQR